MVRISPSKRRRARMMLLCAIAPIAAALAPTARAAVHLSGVVSGSASISQSGPITTIRTSNNAILNFSQFNVARGCTVDFLQPSAASRELDHVNSAAPSLVNGSIVSNGTVYLVNPAGVIFGPGAVVDVNGIYVAGSHMADQDFLNKADHFSGISGVVSNSGQIRANQVYLIGSQVINEGSIVAPNGMVAMLAGSDVLVSQQGSHVTAKVVPAVAAASANSNSSQTDLRASGLAAGDVYSLAIRHTGSIQAANVLINGPGGQVQVSGSIDASSKTAGTTGGTVAITGGQVDLVSAQINASGPAGGGTVDIGGEAHGGGDLAHADSVSLDSGTIINADAVSNGPGGSIVLWSESYTGSSATLTARGGPLGGDGGYIETSGEYVQVTNAPNESAPNGKLGTWVLDPLNIEIILGPDNGAASLTGNNLVTNGTIEAALLTGNVIVTTNQTGTDPGALSQDADAPISVALTSNATLTLQANADMTLNGGISNTGAATLSVELDQLNSTGNAVTINTNPISINGSLTILGGKVSLGSGIGITAASVQISSGTAGTGQSLTTGTIDIAGPIVTNGGVFVAGGTSFTTTPGGTINTTGATTGEVDINPSGAVSIGDAITTGGAGVYIDFSKSSGPAANGTITTSAAIITGGGVFAAGGTSFTSTTGGTINTTGTTNGEVDIDPNGAVSIGDTITTGSGSSGGGGIYLDYGTSSTATQAPNGAIGISAAIATGGGGFFAGGTTFTANAGGTIATSGGKVTILPSSGIILDAAVVTGGGVFYSKGTSFTSNAGGTINTTGTTNGEVDIDPNGTVSIGDTITTGSGSSGGGGIYLDYGTSSTATQAPNGAIGISAAIATGGGKFFAGGTTFTANTGGTIATSGGNVTIAPSGGITIGANVDTGGGAFTATGTSFATNAHISDDSVSTGSNELSINTTAGSGSLDTIDINGALTWTAGTGRSVVIEGGGNVTIEVTTGSITGSGALPISLYTTATAGNVTLNGTVSTSGAFVSDGGNFTVGSSAALTAASVTLNTVTTAVNGDAKALTNGSVTLSAPVIVTGGGSFSADGTTFTANTGATITTSDGNVTILPSAADVVDAAVTTGGGIFKAAGTSFTSSASGTINTTGTTGGEVDILPAGPISIGGTIATGSGSSGGGGIYLDFETSSNPSPAGNGTIGISAAIATGGGGFFAGGTTFTNNTGGTIATSGGNVTIEPNTGTTIDATITTGAGGIYLDYGTSASPAPVSYGPIAINAAVTTGGGGFFAGGTTFTTATTTNATTGTVITSGTIATSGGNVTIKPSGAIIIGANVDTTGGAFTAAGTSFATNANISNDAVNTSGNELSINTTSSSGSLDTITINGALTWAAGTGGSVVIEGGGDVTVESTGSISGGAVPISLYTTGAPTVFVVNNVNVTYNNVTVDGIVGTAGAFISAGGNFTVGATTAVSALLTASTVTLNTATVTPDSKTLNNGTVTISGPVLTTGAFLATGITSYIENQQGTVNTQGGSVTIANNGLIILGAAITTGGGNFASTLGTSFSNSGTGTVTTGGGSVAITTTSGGEGITIGAAISTGGGAFTATGPSLSASSAISDGGVSTGSNAFSVNTTSGAGAITISAPISWSGGTGRSVSLEGAGNVDITTTGRITATGTLALPVSLYSTGSNTTVTVAGIIDTTGDFVSAGGTFVLSQPSATPAPTVLTASTVTLNTATLTPDGKSLSNSSVFIGGPVITHGPFAAGGTVEFTDYESGSVTTNGGAFTITNNGLLSVGQPINTGGGNFSAVDGTGFTNGSYGNITTGGGSMTIVTSSSDGITIDGNVNTGGGGFSATGEAFTSTGSITDGGVATANGAFLLSTSTGQSIDYITIGGAITWTGGTGRSVTIEGPYTFNIDGGITSTGTAPLKVVIDSTNASSTINIDTAVNVSGPFVSDGGSFNVASSGSVTALSVALETNSTTPGGQSVTAGAVTVNGPIVTQGAAHGGFTANGTSFSESASTGTITTDGGVVSLTTSSGAITIEGAVSTGGGAFTVNSASTFTNSGAGTISTGGGAVTIQAADTTTGISIGALVNTGGGNFSATAPVFGNTAEITDGGVNDSNPAGLTITTTASAIYVDGPISWAASHSPITFNYPTNYGVSLDGNITANNAEPLNFSNVFIALAGSATITGGNITMGTVVNGLSSGAGSLVIQSAGTVSLQAIGGTSSSIGSLTVTGNNSAAPVTTLNGSIYASGNVDFAGTVIVPANVDVVGSSTSGQTLEFDGTIEGPGGLTVVDDGANGDQILFNNNIGDQTPPAFLDLFPGEYGIVAFRWGTGSSPPGVSQQQPLTTVNIASGGNFEVNVYSSTIRTFSSTLATIDSYGPLTIDFGAGAAANQSNLYAVGQNEKLSVYGALTIDANGGTVTTGDISNTGNLTIEASTVDFVLRGPTYSNNTEIDTGIALVSGGEMSLPPYATYVGVKGSDGSGSFNVPGFVATSFDPSSNIGKLAGQLGTAYSVVHYIPPALLFGTDNLLVDLSPSMLTATIPTFAPPIPYVYDYPISGAAPREMLVAGSVPRDFKEAFLPTYPGPVLQLDLKDDGVLTGDPTIDEILGEVDTGALYNDLPPGPRPKPADYRAAANRLDPRSVQAFLTRYTEVFGSNAQNRKVQMATDFQTAWDAYVSQSGDQPVSGSGFAQYCAATPSASNAQADLRQLHGLREQLGTLGLSYKEAQVAFQYNILAGMSANGMREGDLAAAVTNVGGSH
jgi:filamentous hemagglutinin family protein